MAKWFAFPHADAAYRYDPAALVANWARLHAGDVEPLPTDERVLAAWALYHAGEFQQACEAGLRVGGAGITVANRAQGVYANYLERSEKARLSLFTEMAERAEAQVASEPANPNALFLLAYALGRYSQGISVAKALSQGIGSRIKTALETVIRLAPQHADAHVALGAFHAEVIDKVGRLLGKTQGADADVGLRLFRQALKLNPGSALARVEYANGLLMVEGDKKMAEAEQLYAQAAACEALDAAQRLDVEMARAELEE